MDLKEFVDSIREYKDSAGIKLPLDGSKISLNPIMKALLSNFVIRMNEFDITNMIFEDGVYEEISKIFKPVKEN